MRRTKLTRTGDIPTYYRFSRVTYKGNKGYAYFLSDKLTDTDKQRLTDTYNNVVIMVGEKVYAPELKTSIVFVADKVIKKLTA